MIASGDDWAALEDHPGDAGTVIRRIYPESRRDLYLELDLETRIRRFTYKRPWGPRNHLPSMPRTQALDCVGRITSGGAVMAISVELHDPLLADVFTAVVGDLAEAVVGAASDDDAVSDLAVRLARWQDLFQSLSREGLGDRERRGLVGELLVLRDDLLPRLHPDAAVDSWTGPLKRNQDFQLPHVALEIKATTGLHPQGFVVNNERELDEQGTGHLNLVHVSLDERLGGDGFSLLDLALEVEARLSPHPLAQKTFLARLARVGFLKPHAHLYGEPHYEVRAIRYYDVGGAFPRIVEGDLREGVGQVGYRVSLAACAKFETQRDYVYGRISQTEEFQ